MNTNSSPIISTKDKKAYSGYVVDLNKKYQVKLAAVEGSTEKPLPSEPAPFIDGSKTSDFGGWLCIREGKGRLFHHLGRLTCRYRKANVFSLVGLIKKKKIDLGALWLEANKEEFILDLKQHFKNQTGQEKLYLFMNDCIFFYFNNRGYYSIELNET
ncbi:MAG: hypothetical protein KDI92_00230 [Xanthomonadales bacterium]|nr:hypothetical protein [Xanthomonadales bacterium]